MIVIGFDTSTRATAVGLRLADGDTLQARDDPASGEHPGHATRLLGLADELLAQGRVPWSALERIAVGLGPGRFTGLRVGVATARGLAQSLSVALVGVSTLRALAEPALERAPHVLSVIDALRGEVFVAGYAAVEGSAARELAVPQPLRPEQVGDTLAALAGTGRARWLAVGDGAVRYRPELETAGVEVPADDSPLHAVRGGAICDLGARAEAPRGDEQLVPDYRRRADAEGVRGRPAAPAALGEPSGARL